MSSEDQQQRRQHVEPLQTVLHTTDGRTIRSSAGLGSEAPAGEASTVGLTGAPRGTPSVEAEGHAKLATGPGDVAGSHGVGSKVGVEDPSNPYVAETASGAAFGLAEGTTPAGPDAYAEPGARMAGRPDQMSRGAPERSIEHERGAANAKGPP
ncbi:hypothetical protein ABPG77_000225 [Micractinium sp. CCAP 211/92]